MLIRIKALLLKRKANKNKLATKLIVRTIIKNYYYYFFITNIINYYKPKNKNQAYKKLKKSLLKIFILVFSLAILQN